MSELFRPVGVTPLAPQMLIINTGTGELWEVIQADQLAVVIKSVSRNCVASMPVCDMKPDSWQLCTPE